MTATELSRKMIRTKELDDSQRMGRTELATGVMIIRGVLNKPSLVMGGAG